MHLRARLQSFLPLALLWPGNLKTQRHGWSGVIINASCNADEAFAEVVECTAETPGAALALYDDTIRQVYSLDPQDQAKGHLGDTVTVQGTLEGSAIHIASLHLFSEVGLRAGLKAPEFSARDQFGKTQTLETRRGQRDTRRPSFQSIPFPISS
jgi:hypothetical protein